ncbi:hypothetical protein SPRG_19703 [Saprolegnia parasitica CBS 223.65]|uniref:Calcium-channel protein CCH1 n=1 Tax=Saprolegnia parasitica (strain CBS 223.65) TaxID=695850 RepID=A0A067CTG1_SAPPC|nr:hypothetical protein SPRG_19703 [Saprolegnia parasitica CBS 223.65]KDO29816.1 hypothetical protein SPRG_19703 [Saprolegnia parasitica CBS 223.65]|eukprot:XP_012199523.1 hypothetical protein SPRG_19703 [Saprolegnia parasitica CBS 223.65]
MLCNPIFKQHVWGQVHHARREKLNDLHAKRQERKRSMLQTSAASIPEDDDDDPPPPRPTIQPRTPTKSPPRSPKSRDPARPTIHIRSPANPLAHMAFKSMRSTRGRSPSRMAPSERTETEHAVATKASGPPSYEARFRRFAKRTLRRKYASSVIAGAVLLDTIVMALDSTGSTALGVLDFLLTLLFASELALRISVHGAFRGHHPFFRDKTAVVQFLVVSSSLLSFCVLGFGTLSQWRVLRGLKAYRCFTAVHGIKRIISAITKAIPLLANVGVLAFFFLLMFSILGLEAFPSVYDGMCAVRGTPNTTLLMNDTRLMYPVVYCSTSAGCPPTFVCANVDSSENNHFHSFQNGFASFLLVFQVMVLDGWIDSIMDPALQTTSDIALLFFIMIVFLLVFLVLNLFVAVITTAFMGHDDDSSNAEPAHAASRGQLDMRKMDKEDEEQHLYMVLGTTMAVEQASNTTRHDVPPLPSLPSARSESDDETSRRTSNTTTDGELTRRMFSSLSLPTETVTSFVSSRDLFAPVHESAEETFRQKLASVPGVSGRLRRWDRMLSTVHTDCCCRFILSETFADLVMMCIIVNTLALMTEYPNMGEPWQTFFDDVEFFFSGVFIIEVLLKFYAFQSMRLFLSAYERWFDAIVVGTSVCYTNDGNLKTLSWMDNVSILRTLRIGRLMWRWQGTRKLIESVLKSSRAVFNLFVFLLLILIVHSVLAMQLFGLEKDMPRRNFQGFVQSFVTLFQVLSGDAWADVMESILERDSLFFAPFFMLFVFFGQFVVLGVLHSVLAMQLFGLEKDMPRRNFQGFVQSFVTLFQVLSGDAWADVMESILERDSLFFAPFFMVFVFFGQFVVLNLFIAVILENFEISEEEAYQLQLERVLAIPKELQMLEKIEEVGVRAFYANNDIRQLENVQDIKARRFLGVSERHIHTTASVAPADAFLDDIVAKIDTILVSATFKWFIILTIVLSCVGLAMDDPVIISQLSATELEAQNAKAYALASINTFALVVFVFEFALKVTSQGFGFRYLLSKMLPWYERAYYRSRYESNARKTPHRSLKKHYIEDPWNRLDFCLLLVAVLDEGISYGLQRTKSNNLVKVLRVGRVLRPLRLFNQDGDMKLIMTSFAAALPAVLDVLVLCLGVFIIFGIAGRTLFSQKMYSCNDTSVANRAQCTGFYAALPLPASDTPVLMPRVWVPYRARFDTLASSMIALMELSSVKWVDTAEFAMDIVGVNEQPILNYSMIYIGYFISFVFIGGFFLIRLFVGVLVRHLTCLPSTQCERSWVELERHMLLLKPRYSVPEPKNATRSRFYRVAKSHRFEHFMSSIIVMNMLFMLLTPTKAAQQWKFAFEMIDKLFVILYSCEFATKLVAFGRHIFRDTWHVFDLVLLIGSYVSYLPGISIHQISQVGRIFRVMRVMKFVKVSKGVRTIFRTFRASLSSIGNVVLLLVLLLYIFAILGRQLFGTVKYGPNLNETQNFQTFGNALLTLFELIAGGEWHLLMTDCMVEGTDCATIGTETDCGDYYAAWMYYLVFVIAIVYIFLNLFIAVILENFRSCYVKDISPVTLEDFEGYQEVFEKYDPYHKGTIPIYMLPRFLHDLPPNLRVSTAGNRMAYLHLRFEIEQVQLAPSTPQRAPFFNALLRTVCIHHMGIRALSYEQQRDRVKQIFVIKEKVAAMIVRAMLRGVIERTRIRAKRETIAWSTDAVSCTPGSMFTMKRTYRLVGAWDCVNDAQ